MPEVSKNTIPEIQMDLVMFVVDTHESVSSYH